MRGLFGSADHAGPVVRGRGRRGHGLRPGHSRTRPGPRRRAACHPAAGLRADREAVPVPAVLLPQAGPAADPGRPAHHGDRAGGERVAAAHQRAAGRGRHPVHAGQQAAVRAGRDRAGRAPGAQLPDPFGQPGQVHHRAAAGPGRGLVRPGGDQPRRSARPARSWSRRRSSRCRGPPRRAAGSARATAGCGRSRPSARTTRRRGPYQDGDSLHRVHWKSTAQVRRADGAPRGTPVAQQRVGVPGHPARGARGRPGPPRRSSSRSARPPRSARTCPARASGPG